MRIDRAAVVELRENVQAFLPAIHESGLIVTSHHLDPATQVAVAVVVTRQLAQASGWSMSATAAALQSMVGINMADLQGFQTSFAHAAQDQPELVRDHVLSAMRSEFVEQLIQDAGSTRFATRVVEMALAAARQEDAPADALPAHGDPNEPLTPEIVEACVRGVISVIRAGGLDPERGIAMLYSGSASFVAPAVLIDEALRRDRQTRSEGPQVRAEVLTQYLAQHAQNLSQGLLLEMGNAWLEENEQRVIQEARLLYADDLQMIEAPDADEIEVPRLGHDIPGEPELTDPPLDDDYCAFSLDR